MMVFGEVKKVIEDIINALEKKSRAGGPLVSISPPCLEKPFARANLLIVTRLN